MRIGAEAPLPAVAPNLITCLPTWLGVQRKVACETLPLDDLTIAPLGSFPTASIATAASGIEVDAVSAKVSFESTVAVNRVRSGCVDEAQTTEPPRAWTTGPNSRNTKAATAKTAANRSRSLGVTRSSDMRRNSDYPRFERVNGGRPEGRPPKIGRC